MGPGTRSSMCPGIKCRTGRVARNGTAEVDSGQIMKSCVGHNEELGFVFYEQ